MSSAIVVDNLSKRYQISHEAKTRGGGYRTLRESLTDMAMAPFRRMNGKRNGSGGTEEFWALKDISFEVKPGEVVGIIGRNGAGKSTLLKILSRITKPTGGHVGLRGRVGSLLEVGTGFHPELTGRENIFLNGSILGMSRRDIARRFDAVVDFAGVEQFLDTPVKRYSSGMYVRLAFAVAAHLEPEILIVDEVLAVGDTEFQKKCLSRMRSISSEGRAVLVVSHNLPMIGALCTRGILLDSGRLQSDGNVQEVVETYIVSSEVLTTRALIDRVDRSGTGEFRFSKIAYHSSESEERSFAVSGSPLIFDLSLCRRMAGEAGEKSLDVAIIIKDRAGQILTTLATWFVARSPHPGPKGITLRCQVEKLQLLPGTYRLDLWCGIRTETVDEVVDAALLDVSSGDYFNNPHDARLPIADRHGAVATPHQWIFAR